MEPDEELQQPRPAGARAQHQSARRRRHRRTVFHSPTLRSDTKDAERHVTGRPRGARNSQEQTSARAPAPGAGPHGPGDADTAHTSTRSDPCIPCTNAGSYSSFPTIIQHVMVYNKEATPYGGVILRIEGNTVRPTKKTPNVRNMVSLSSQYDDLLETCRLRSYGGW